MLVLLLHSRPGEPDEDGRIPKSSESFVMDLALLLTHCRRSHPVTELIILAGNHLSSAPEEMSVPTMVF